MESPLKRYSISRKDDLEFGYPLVWLFENNSGTRIVNVENDNLIVVEMPDDYLEMIKKFHPSFTIQEIPTAAP